MYHFPFDEKIKLHVSSKKKFHRYLNCSSIKAMIPTFLRKRFGANLNRILNYLFFALTIKSFQQQFFFFCQFSLVSSYFFSSFSASVLNFQHSLHKLFFCMPAFSLSFIISSYETYDANSELTRKIKHRSLYC